MSFLIIIINYNNWKDTIDCIKSLMNVGVNSSNILLIENASTNDSFERLKAELTEINIIRTDKNLGFTGANNLGILYAVEHNNDYAILLNNDTIIENNSINILVNEMETNSEVSIGTGRIFYYPDKDIIWYNGGKLVYWRGLAIHYDYGKKISTENLKNISTNINFISGCYMCIRLRDYEKLGLLNEKFFLYLDDVEYSVRAVKNNIKMKYFPNSVIYHKANGEKNLTSGMVYYSIRNRRLLINLHFGIVAKIYFEVVLIIKRSFWFLTGNKYYSILVTAIDNYNNKYFGQAPENIK